jgi:type VI secretion system FHA domain protein
MELTLLAADELDDQAAMDEMLRPGDKSGELSGLTEFPLDGSATTGAEAQKRILAELSADFLKAAGVDPDNFHGMDPREIILNAGRLLSEYTEGTHALLVSKEKINAQFQLKAQDNASPSNPLRAADGLNNALRLLLGNPSDVSSSGAEAIEAAFRELIQHQKAVVNAMQSALADYMGHFEPEALEYHFNEQQQKTGSGAATFRELYARAYEGLAQPNGRKLPKRFDEEFSRAYERETADET